MGVRLSALAPDNADPWDVADGIARVVALSVGDRLFRSMIDFIRDGATMVTEVTERTRE